MNYDKIILELLSRVQELEEQMEIVNDKLLKLKTLNNIIMVKILIKEILKEILLEQKLEKKQ